ncbi:hypothetical protein [Salinicola halophyticus]|uniref:hypothetical protein n=1 Tax=Salinicola halophyticus TaxID=1808881 RepID=UPI003F483CB8
MKLMQRIYSLITRIAPPKRWPRWLLRFVEARALTGSVISSVIAIEMIVELVPATYRAGITREAIQIWGYALLFVGAALWFASEAAWIERERHSRG